MFLFKLTANPKKILKTFNWKMKKEKNNNIIQQQQKIVFCNSHENS